MKSIIRSCLFAFSICAIFSCSESDGGGENLMFDKIPVALSGVDFANTLTTTQDQNILDYLYFYNGGGVSIGDINNDGLPDIYLTGNQVKNRLYLNKGNLVFEDITAAAGVEGNSTWNTGCTMADVNGDGWMDIYVSAVVGINGFNGYNELFINNGDNTFTESAVEYGLDLENYSSQAAFFDADNDGDLDVYILNHAIHTVNSFGPASIRYQRVEESGDKLLLNENGKFIDYSEKAGIYGGANSYGLGITTADFNNDGFTDIYVSNDFHEDDYYYLNNGDGTFTESLKSNFGHISRFSMGSDAADINQDGFYDLITLDMLPETESVLKSSEGDENINTHKLRVERLGYHPQYSRNMLQLNQNGRFFSEIGLKSGVAASDWSWGALFGDYDQDGIQDLFISNGIPKRPNDLDYIKYISNEQIQQKLEKTHFVDQEALELMPPGAITNYSYKGKPNGAFQKTTDFWVENDSIISTGLAYGDLDNDGDLDIVTNNVNEIASIYENVGANGNYLKIEIKSPEENTSGIGAKAILYSDAGKQYRQLYTTKGWQSSSEPIIHFGIAPETKLDSLLVVFPDRTYQIVKGIQANQSLVVRPNSTRDTFDFKKLTTPDVAPWFIKTKNNLGIDFEHQENNFIDFNGQKLIPHQVSDNAPAVAVGDLNNDGKDDVVFGNSRFQKPAVYLQKEGRFTKNFFQELSKDSIVEDTAILVEDFNTDGRKDLFMATGGGESIGNSELLFDRLFMLQADGSFIKDVGFPQIPANVAVAKGSDFDNDGDIDLFIGVDNINYRYGALPDSYLLVNENGKFKRLEQPVFKNIGLVTDAVWSDFDQDGDKDLIVVGEWMAPKFIRNDNSSFVDVSLKYLPSDLNGMWQSIVPFDIDEDGDDDYLLGNWGLNTKLNASKENPLLMYYADFDDNGFSETLMAQEKEGAYYFLYGLDEMAAQLTFLKKKFTSYKEFAGKKVEEIFDQKILDRAVKMKIHILASGYLLNESSEFTFNAFADPLQDAPLRCFLKYDFDGDAKEEVLIGGNYFGVTPYHGKFDAFGGAIVKQSGKVLNSHNLGLNFAQKAVQNLSIIKVENENYLLVTYNNDKAEVYSLGLK